MPMEVMGLMLGHFVDDYTVNCIDVFAMPQSGTGVSVEAVDPVFQTKMLDMLKQTGRPEVSTAVLQCRTAPYQIVYPRTGHGRAGGTVCEKTRSVTAGEAVPVPLPLPLHAGCIHRSKIWVNCCGRYKRATPLSSLRKQSRSRLARFAPRAACFIRAARRKKTVFQVCRQRVQ